MMAAELDSHGSESGEMPGGQIFRAEKLTKIYQMGEVEVVALRDVDLPAEPVPKYC